MCVLVSAMADQLATGDKRHVTIGAFVWSGAWTKGKDKSLFPFVGFCQRPTLKNEQ